MGTAVKPEGPRSGQPGFATLFVAPALGAVVTGFLDMLRGGTDNSVSVMRIGQVLKENFHAPAWAADGAGALFILALIAMALSWAWWRPQTRKDGFAFGLAVLTMLSMLAGYPPNGNQSDGSVVIPKLSTESTAEVGGILEQVVKSAYAQEVVSTTPRLWTYYFQFVRKGGPEKARTLALNVYDKSERQLLSQVTVPPSGVIALRLPVGEYVMHVECAGCNRVKIDVEVEPRTQGAKVSVPESRLPVGLQRLYRPAATDVVDLKPDEVRQLEAKLASGS